MSDILDGSLFDAAAAVREKKISSVELTTSLLSRIKAKQPHLNCFLSIDEDQALASARLCDRALEEGTVLGPLHGIPLAHKDMFFRIGKIATCGSKILKTFVPNQTSTALSRLSAAGAVNVGTLNMSEFALGPTGHNVHYGAVRNPINPAHVSGGSSSGSGAAVSAQLIFGSLGSDTAGSIRIPAACCGVVGLKPTNTRVSRYGTMGLCFSLDCVGPLARTVKDCCILTKVIAGRDANDHTTSPLPVPDYLGDLDKGIEGVRIGIPSSWYFDNIDTDVGVLLHGALKVFERIGCRIVEVPVPHHNVIPDMAGIVMASEAATLHKKWLRERPGDYSPQVRARILAGLGYSATQYLEALHVREKIVRDFVHEVYSRADVLFLPVIEIPVPTIDATDVGAGERMDITISRMNRCTRPINYLGLPSLAVPCGRTSDGLPNGFQLVGPPFEESRLFQAGIAYERATGGFQQV